jgi:protein-L-isoaspartate(D-aspartate) O-methyltransferase
VSQQLLREGIGMTSRRTRERLLNRLQDQGIHDEAVLETIVETPRHLFIDEALSHKAY